MNSSTRISPIVAGLRFVINMACPTHSCDRPDIHLSPRPGRYPIEKSAAIAARQSRSNALRQKINFLSRFNLIWVVQSFLEKYFPLSQPQITTIFPSIPSHMRGVSRSSRT
jgi:hypothetical protein